MLKRLQNLFAIVIVSGVTLERKQAATHTDEVPPLTSASDLDLFTTAERPCPQRTIWMKRELRVIVFGDVQSWALVVGAMRACRLR